jgi:hypothetical protein
MKRFTYIALLTLMLLLTGCADKIVVNDCLPLTEPSGFWKGTWHGMIMFPSFIGSLIWDDVAVYAVNNNGGWYDFGFVGGFFIVLKFFTTLLNARFKK